MYQEVEQMPATYKAAKSGATHKILNHIQCREPVGSNLEESLAAIEQSKVVLTWIEKALKTPMIQETLKQIIQTTDVKS